MFKFDSHFVDTKWKDKKLFGFKTKLQSFTPTCSSSTATLWIPNGKTRNYLDSRPNCKVLR